MTRIVILALLVLTGTVRADDRKAAEQLFRIGKAAYDADRYDAAATNLDRAYELYEAPEIAFSAAQAHRLQYQADRNSSHLKRAIELYEAYIAAVPSGGKRRDALTHLERLRDILGRLEASGPKVVVVEKPQPPSIYVSVAIEGALITIDGKAVDRYTSLDVEPGEHIVAVSADGYLPEQRKVMVTNRQALVPIELQPRPATLTVTSPGAHVLVDGRKLSASGVAPGKRLLTVYARGRRAVTRELQLAPGQELALDIPLQPTTQRRAVKWVAIGGGTLLAGTLITGVVAVIANSSAADLRDSTTPLDTEETRRYERLRDRYQLTWSARSRIASSACPTVISRRS
ncbi:MAG: hypothetical protein ABI867_14410, partial [Kofleriaceae bacterium]